MATITETPPLLVIVGETASGKSALALTLAEELDGEIIAGDARTIYRGMDIGTAKPTAAERLRVTHHLIDELDPDEPITAATFKMRALQAIDDINRRGKLSILVGGSGLYVDSILFDYSFNTPNRSEQRSDLNKKSVEELQDMLHMQGIKLPENAHNPRHLVRALETGGQKATRTALRSNTLVIGTSLSREILKQNITERVETMLLAGLENEVRKLVARYGWNDVLAQTIGYKEFKKYFEGTENIDHVKQAIIKDTLAYAKRQKTWFRRNEAINYPCNSAEAVDIATTWLNKLQ